MKIISHKSWQLTNETLLQVYNVLIRSVMDYSAILMPVICETNKNKLQVIQNNALRIILKKPKLTKTRIVDLHLESKLETLEERFLKLRRRYVQKAIINSNPVILELIDEFKNFKGGRLLTKKTLLCDLYEDLVAGMTQPQPLEVEPFVRFESYS